MRDAAHVVRTEGGRNDRFVFKQDLREPFEIRVALRFLQKHRNIPAVLSGFDFLVVPIGALHQPHGEPRPASAAPIDQIDKVVLGIAEIGLNDDAGVRPIPELLFAEQCFEKLDRCVLVGVTLHVEVHKRAQLAGAGRIGHNLGARCAIASAGSAGFICE